MNEEQISPETPSYAQRLDALILSALFKDDEVTDGQQPPDAVVAEGIMTRMGFHPQRLASIKEPLRELLRELLADDFLKDKGGGYSFLALCNDRNGELWTGMHMAMDHLCILSIASGFASFCLPRELWTILPGGMPYVVFDLEAA